MAKAFSTGSDQLNLIDSTSGASESETTSTGSIVLLNGSTTYGSLGRLFCPNGTIMFGLGNRIIQCQENGFWSKLGTFCLPINRTSGKEHEKAGAGRMREGERKKERKKVMRLKKCRPGPGCRHLQFHFTSSRPPFCTSQHGVSSCSFLFSPLPFRQAIRYLGLSNRICKVSLFQLCLTLLYPLSLSLSFSFFYPSHPILLFPSSCSLCVCHFFSSEFVCMYN